MRTFRLAIVAIALGAAVSASAAPSSLAVVADPTGSPARLSPAVYFPADRPALERAGYVYAGRRFCWYPGGWRGAGWYRCGFAQRRGYGWGGPEGWRGWRREGWRRGVRHRRWRNWRHHHWHGR
jgi:hypothetical protein